MHEALRAEQRLENRRHRIGSGRRSRRPARCQHDRLGAAGQTRANLERGGVDTLRDDELEGMGAVADAAAPRQEDEKPDKYPFEHVTATVPD